MIATDPGLTLANLTAPGSNKILDSDVLWISNAGTRSQQVFALPIIRGTTLFVTVAAAMSVVVYLGTFIQLS